MFVRVFVCVREHESERNTERENERDGECERDMYI